MPQVSKSGHVIEIRVPFFLLFGVNKGTQKEKGQKGPTGIPRRGSLGPKCRTLHSEVLEGTGERAQDRMKVFACGFGGGLGSSSLN